jgi:hypothetical protein
MRVVTNQPRIKRNRQIAQVLFFLSLALIAGLIFANFKTLENESLFLAQCLLMPIVLITIVISVRLTNQYVRPPHAEDAIRDGLKGINRRSILYNYVLPSTNHVLVAPQGVYTFTTRFQDTRFKVDGDQWVNYKARGPLAPISLFFKQEALGNPFKQATSDANAVQAIVDQAVPGAKIKVQPVVVFTSPKATLEVIDPEIPVVSADLKKKPSLKSLLRIEKKKEDAIALTPAQMESIDEAIMSTLGARKRKSQLVEEV